MAVENGDDAIVKADPAAEEAKWVKKDAEEGEDSLLLTQRRVKKDDEDDAAGERDSGEAPMKAVEIHPFENAWTFWFDNHSGKSKQIPWGSSIRSIYTFSSAEEFWGVYNNINHPSKLSIGSDFHCFKEGIEPKWEDPVCANGGKWTLSCSRGKVDHLWLHTLLAMIGEQFDHGDDICGAVVNVRAKAEKISIWTKNGLNEVTQTSIGRQWKEQLDYNDTIGFILHEDAKRQDRYAKSRYQV
ncbi:eukaryotic translation initiation factor 4E-1 [Canna indica]|uniref:eIF-4F 25 kDa subunit n=1 Tax=Canna indica TaxID=4628 RepID=A0AAQ3KYU7_9LILI|nr:eukaryotic translation initiation factor 4E-1 [Canna indica]